MKLYISADIEGVVGIASLSQCGAADPSRYDYPFARRMLTDDLKAVIRGARRAGVQTVVLKDGHGNCKYLLSDELEPGTELISGQGSTLDGMMDGIDGTFDAAMLVGYHGMAGAARSMMEHALVGGLHSFWINDRKAGEILTNAAVAGAYGVPTVLVESDDGGTEEAASDIPGVKLVSTKMGFGKYMGRMRPVQQVREELEGAAFDAVSRRESVAPVTVAGPVKMKVSFRSSQEAEFASTLKGVDRLDAYSLQWEAASFLGAHGVALNVFRLSMQGRRSHL